MKKLLLATALFAAFSGYAQTTNYTPISLTGFNADIIANGPGSAMVSTNNGADASDFALAAQNYVNPTNQTPAAGTALPNNGLITSAITTTPGLTFQLAPFTGNNSLRILNAASGTINFSTPTTATDLFVLVTPVAYVATFPVTITVNFTDATTQVFSGITFNNWYGGANPAWSGSSRVKRTTDVIDVQTVGPRFFQQKLTLSAANTSKAIQSITFANNSGATTNNILNVMAVTAQGAASTLATDAGIIAASNPNSGCLLTSQETITVTVKNYGTTPQSSIPVSYTIGSGNPVNEIVPGPIPANTAVTFSFNTKANFSAAGTYNLSIRTNLPGDLAPTNDVLNQIITLGAVPATPTITTSGTATLCTGGSVTLTVASTSTGVTYQWFKNGVAIANAISANYTTNTAGSYTATAVIAGSCSSPVSAATALTVTSTPIAPVISVTGSLAICTGGSVVLTANSVSGATFTWFRNNTVIPGATAGTYTATTIGSYTVVANLNGCGSPASTASVVTNKTPVTPTITQAGTVLTSSATSGNQWYKDGILITGAVNRTLTVTGNGVYTVVVIFNGCSSAASSGITISTMGIKDAQFLPVSVYPNPSNGLFNLTLPAGQVYEITVSDLTGKVIMTQATKEAKTQLDLNKAAKGIYLLKLVSEGKTATRKLIVE